MLRVSEGQSWASAIMGVLPMRKGAIALDADPSDEADEKTTTETPDVPGSVDVETDAKTEQSDLLPNE